MKGSIRGDIDSLLVLVKNPNMELDQIVECEEKLHKLSNSIIHKESIKWYVGIYGFIFTFFLFFVCIFPAIYYGMT